MPVTESIVAVSIGTQLLVLVLVLKWTVLVVACDDGHDCLWQRMNSVAHGLCDGLHACIVVAGMWCCK